MTLNAGEVRHETIRVAANSAVVVEFVQVDGTLQLHAHGARAEESALIQNDAGRQGRIRLTLLSDIATTWQIDIAARDGKQAHYTFRKFPPHAITPLDRARARAETAWAERENERRKAGSLEHGDASSTDADIADRYTQAATLAAQSKDACLKLMIETSHARMEFARGHYAPARKFAEAGLAAGCDDRHDVSAAAEIAAAQRTLASAIGYLGDFAASTRFAESALTRYRRTGDQNYQAMQLANLSANYRAMGATQKALDDARQSLHIAESIGDARRAAFCRESIAAIHLQRGDYGLALDAYRQTIEAVRNSPYPMIEAMAWNDMGLLYASFDDHDEAAAAFADAEAAWRRNGDENGLQETMLNEGELALAAGNTAQAIERFQSVLDFDIAHGLQREQAHARGAIGRAYLQNSDWVKAETQLTASRDLATASGVVELQAAAELALGDLARKRERDADADVHYARAVTVARSANDGGTLAAADASRARIALDAGHAGDAETLLHDAIAVIEDERRQINPPSLRTTYFATRRSYYDADIAALLAEGTDASSRRALQVSENARARALRDSLIERQIDVMSSADPALLAEERNAEDALRVAVAANASADVERALRRLDEVRGRIRAADPRYSQTMQDAVIDIESVQRALRDSQAVVVEYWLGDVASVAWIVDANRIETIRLPPRRTIDTAVDAALAAIVERGSDVATSSFEALAQHQNAKDVDAAQRIRDVSAQVFENIAKRVDATSVVVIGDGELQRFPFGLLDDRIRFSYLPSLATMTLLREAAPRATADVVLIGDAVFRSDDARLLANTPLDAGRAFARTPHARAEIDGIAALKTASASSTLSGFRASLSDVEKVDWTRYAIAHFATHSIIDLSHPELSGIVLSRFDASGAPQNGFARLTDIYHWRMPVDLVTLSVCDASNERGRGAEGIFGLSRAFFYAGARRVVLSLWPVDDEASAQLMIAFYRHLFEDAPNPADALRIAQREIRNDARWRAPYYWAGFVVQGDWR